MNWDLSLTLILLGVTASGVLYLAWRGRNQSAVFQEVDRVTSQMEELTLRVVELELDRAGYRLWTAQLRGQIVELGHTPVPPPPWLVVTGLSATAGAPAESVLVQVYHRISEYFSLDEIRDLAFQAGINAEAFGGDTRSARAQALVEYAARYGKLAELVRMAQRLRPDTNWPVIGTGYQGGKE